MPKLVLEFINFMRESITVNTTTPIIRPATSLIRHQDSLNAKNETVLHTNDRKPDFGVISTASVPVNDSSKKNKTSSRHLSGEIFYPRKFFFSQQNICGYYPYNRDKIFKETLFSCYVFFNNQ